MNYMNSYSHTVSNHIWMQDISRFLSQAPELRAARYSSSVYIGKSEMSEQNYNYNTLNSLGIGESRKSRMIWQPNKSWATCWGRLSFDSTWCLKTILWAMKFHFLVQQASFFSTGTAKISEIARSADVSFAVSNNGKIRIPDTRRIPLKFISGWKHTSIFHYLAMWCL